MREVMLRHLNLEGWQHPRCGVFTQGQEGRPSHPARGKAGVPSPFRQTCVLVVQSCLILCNPMNYSPPGSSVHGDSPGKNTGEGRHSLLQGIFLTQGWNPGLLHCRQILYCLSAFRQGAN